ncbi:tetratricopeptide (TPR) repeat protein [Pedobacter africanus]|uniref:Tetratricopeptide (TPR) repeat protein n=1 Tax=Pedobacter africanus TaxID=151894 RepID=A0ACC6L0V4_9SPHI|nr:RagB/SusD family nutrient uptake outer membrane protein [Pedobacter africanus]MDR6785260.1 tetratricopeptide (TPR) repeat protein [Pedobacter africanus]
MKKQIIYISAFVILSTFYSCKKYLEAVPDSKLAIPTTLEDFQAILDYTETFNAEYPNLLELASDDYYIKNDVFNRTSNIENDTYLWKKNETHLTPWFKQYDKVNRANIVLDEMVKIKTSANSENYKSIKGQAYFYRAYSFYLLSQLYGYPYDHRTSISDLGIPLRLTSDINVPSKRSTVQECFNRIITDLQAAIDLLPVQQNFKTRPSKGAALGVLAKVYLSMGDYTKATEYADKLLRLHSKLIDYNSLDSTAVAPFSIFNDEVLFHSTGAFASFLQAWVVNIDSSLLNSYHSEDLRKAMFFSKKNDETYSFKGGYDGYYFGLTRIFLGIAVDEIYLIRAEGNARMGNLEMALNDLNLLISKRWKVNKFKPFISSSQDEIINWILLERRKELVFRGLRWQDLRRLMKDPGREIVPKRVINNKIYELLPNSLRYTFAIPAAVITKTGMEQNP